MEKTPSRTLPPISSKERSRPVRQTAYDAGAAISLRAGRDRASGVARSFIPDFVVTPFITRFT